MSVGPFPVFGEVVSLFGPLPTLTSVLAPFLVAGSTLLPDPPGACTLRDVFMLILPFFRSPANCRRPLLVIVSHENRLPTLKTIFIVPDSQNNDETLTCEARPLPSTPNTAHTR